MGLPMCSKEGLNTEARPAGVRNKKLFTTAAAKGSIMGTRTWVWSAVEAVFRLEPSETKLKLKIPATWS
jgi:hypothetical protein